MTPLLARQYAMIPSVDPAQRAAIADRLPAATRCGRALAERRPKPGTHGDELRLAGLRVFAAIGILAFMAFFGLSLLMAFAPAERSIVFRPSEGRARLPAGWDLAAPPAPPARLEQVP